MSLNINHQLTLLYDLLQEQTNEATGTIAEYEQMNRLIQAMTADPQFTDRDVKNILPAIYEYCSQGEHAKDSTEHIQAYQAQLNEWVETIYRSIDEMK